MLVFWTPRPVYSYGSASDLDNIKLVFQNLAEHIAEFIKNSSKITTFFIIGGNDEQQRFSDLQAKIDMLINGDKDDIDDEISPYYQQLLDSVKYIDVRFNIQLKPEECFVWSSTDIIVDKCSSNENITVFINQYVQTSKGLTILIGVLLFEILNKTKLFVVNQLEINNHKDETSPEYQLVNNVAEHFQSRSAALGGVKCENDLAIRLLNYSRGLSSQIDQKFYENQRQLSPSDQEMCECLHGESIKINRSVDMDDHESDNIDNDD
ncbi:unnamed protein product [Didymodactylos carnosus]|uniref:Uncharacterized protein n=1 Tax=Didymodactylos carnosus TaxID=1234261 RepID=A0A8S2DFG7_9BILA|nr:unnamed protein product [Didymodactylos carnosus]CAF3721716.1 unnamed protein product [Didymodactylos carnosus]